MLNKIHPRQRTHRRKLLYSEVCTISRRSLMSVIAWRMADTVLDSESSLRAAASNVAACELTGAGGGLGKTPAGAAPAPCLAAAAIFWSLPIL